MRLLLLNLNYLQYQNIIKTVHKIITNFEHPTPRENLRHKNKTWGKQNDTHAL